MANKAQRKVNHYIRSMNKALAKDEFLGLNRFSVNQVAKYNTIPFWETRYEVQIRDNKTGEVEVVWIDNYDYRHVFFWKVNDFIIKVRLKEGW